MEHDELVHMYGTSEAMPDEILCVHSKVVLYIKSDGESPADVLIVASMQNWALNTFVTCVKACSLAI